MELFIFTDDGTTGAIEKLLRAWPRAVLKEKGEAIDAVFRLK